MTEPIHVLKNWSVFTVDRTFDALAAWFRAHPPPDVKPSGADNATDLIWLVTPAADASRTGHPKYSRKRGYDVTHTHGAFFDIDGAACAPDAATATAAALRAAGLGFIWSGSHSATADVLRGHIQLIFDSPCPAEQHARVWLALHAAIAPLVDRRQHNPVRGRNVPRLDTDVVVQPGALVDWRAWLERAPAHVETEPAPPTPPSPTQDSTPDRDVAGVIAEVWGRGTTGDRAFGGLGGWLCRLGVSHDRAVWIATAVANATGSTHPDVERRVDQAYEGDHQLGFTSLVEALEADSTGAVSASGAFGGPRVAVRIALDRAEALLRASVAALVAAPLTAAPAGWSVMAGSLMGAPQSVERALKAWRAQHVKRDPGTTPELANSSAVVKWLVNAKGLSADRVGAELGEDAASFARTLTGTDPTVQNVGRLTRIDQCLAVHELRWNEMALTVEIDGEPWTDNHTAAVRLALEQSGASDPEKPTPNGDIEQRSRAVAAPYHPVLEYLTALPPWDGVPRVDRLWVEYFGAANTELNRKLGACFALGAVRRVLEPGTKVDMMPILLGGQGDFKSSGLAALVGGPPFFTDAAPGFGHRSENAMTLAGCWVWEIAEMQGMDRADLNAVKAFVTRSEDDVLLPYARAKTRLRRRSVLIGTTNDDQCLTDPTGSRRHPVIPIAAIDRAGMVRDRDAFWAEALHRVRAGERHWLEKDDERAMGERNLQYTRRDEGTIGALVAWFNRPAHTRGVSGDTFTIADAVQYALGGRTDGGSAARVGLALKTLGVEHRRVGRSKIRVYEFPPSEAQIGGCTDSTQPQPVPSTDTGTPDRT